MKLTKQFIMREIMGDYVIVPVGQTALELNGMITVNETGAFLWKKLEEECTMEMLVAALLDEYEVSEEQAKEDVREFLDILEKNAIL